MMENAVPRRTGRPKGARTRTDAANVLSSFQRRELLRRLAERALVDGDHSAQDALALLMLNQGSGGD